MSAGSYKQNAITTIMLVTLPSFVKKNYFHRPALKKLSNALKKYFFLSINYQMHHPHLISLLASTINH